MADIELVIKIPEDMYQKIKETSMVISGRRSGKRFDYILFNAVNTGTLLPKRHGRLIDAEHFVEEHPLAFVRDVINNEPTIIKADKEESGTDNGKED